PRGRTLDCFSTLLPSERKNADCADKPHRHPHGSDPLKDYTMLTSLDPSSLSFLNGMEQIQQRSQRALQEMTTGLKINTLSDAPDQIANLYETRSELAQTQQIDTNLARVRAEGETGDWG